MWFTTTIFMIGFLVGVYRVEIWNAIKDFANKDDDEKDMEVRTLERKL